MRQKLRELQLQLETLENIYTEATKSIPEAKTVSSLFAFKHPSNPSQSAKSDYKPLWNEVMKQLTSNNLTLSNKDIENIAKSMGIVTKASTVRVTMDYYSRAPKNWVLKVGPGVYCATDKGRKEFLG